MGKAWLVVLSAIGILVVAPLFGIIGGAFCGFIVGLFFNDTVRGFLAAFGFSSADLAMWQIGAGLGFVSSFFRAYSPRYDK